MIGVCSSCRQKIYIIPQNTVPKEWNESLNQMGCSAYLCSPICCRFNCVVNKWHLQHNFMCQRLPEYKIVTLYDGIILSLSSSFSLICYSNKVAVHSKSKVQSQYAIWITSSLFHCKAERHSKGLFVAVSLYFFYVYSIESFGKKDYAVIVLIKQTITVKRSKDTHKVRKLIPLAEKN